MKKEEVIDSLKDLIEQYDMNCIDSVNEEIEMWRKAYLDSMYGKENNIYSYFLAIPSKSFMKKPVSEWVEEIKKYNLNKY